jgi:hypothetical protein
VYAVSSLLDCTGSVTRQTVCSVVLTHLPVLFVAALHMACVVHQKDCKQWFAELSVDMGKVSHDSWY